MDVECLKEVCNRVVVVEMYECFIREEFGEYLLKHYLELKRSEKIRNKSVIIGTGNNWLLQNYPTSEHLKLTESHEIEGGELKVVFDQHSNYPGYTPKNIEIFPSKLPNLERFFFREAKSVQISIFVRGSAKLKVIKVLGLVHPQDFFLFDGFSRFRRDEQRTQKITESCDLYL